MTSSLLFPAAAIKTDPLAKASLMAVCNDVGQIELTLKDMLITFAGVALFAIPLISPPLAQVIEVAISESNPPRHDNALIG